MSFYPDQAGRARKCNECNTIILPGTWHVKINSNSFYNKNVCLQCVARVLDLCNSRNAKEGSNEVRAEALV